jgi:hypothetical protein
MRLIMGAAAGLDPDKRGLLIARLSAQFKQHLSLVRHPTDGDIARCIERALEGLAQ